jgi:hypothetical protein
MRTRHALGSVVAAVLSGVFLNASCSVRHGEDALDITRAAGTNAMDDARASCGAEFRSRYQHLLAEGSTATNYWGQAAFDAAARRLFVLADSTSGRVVHRCDVSRTPVECTAISIPNTEVILGASQGRFAVLTLDRSTFRKDLVTCTYDGECSRTEVPRDSGGALDAANGTVIVHSVWLGNGETPGTQFRVCPLRGGDCGAPWFQPFSRFDIRDVVVDTSNGLQYIALHSTAEIMECAGSDGTFCAGFAATAFPDLQGPAQLLVDANALSVLKREIIAPSEKLVLFRCLREGRTCKRQELALGEGPHQIESYTAVLDSERGRLLVVTQDFFRGMKPTLYACAPDGTMCTEVDISAGTAGQSGHNPRAFFDGSLDRILVVTNGTASRLGLFDVNLCKGEDPTKDAGLRADAGNGSGRDAGAGGKSW